MAEREHVNIRNIYIDLLNKIKNVEGVDKDYVDGLVALIDQHLIALDQDFNALISVIPEEASLTDPLVITSQLSPVAFSGDYDDLTDKPSIIKPRYLSRVYFNASQWEGGTSVTGILLGEHLNLDYPFICWQIPYGSDYVSGEQADFNLIKKVSITRGTSEHGDRIDVEASATPTHNLAFSILAFK